MSPRRSAAGFTLLEVVLATTVAAMMAMALYASMSVAMKARRSAAETVDPAREATIVMDRIARMVAAVPPPTGILAGPFLGAPGGIAQGSRDTLTFFTFEDRAHAGAGLVRIDLFVRDDAASPSLVAQVQRKLLATTTPTVEEEPLCRDVVGFEADYFDGSAWTDTWDSTLNGDTLPQAVRITLTLERGGGDEPRRTRVTRIVPLSCHAPAVAEEGEVAG